MGDAKQQDIAAVELIDLESMRRFIVVAEELNFTRAAARLGLSSHRSRRPSASWSAGSACGCSSAPAAGLAFVPVSDLSPSEVVVAWPDASRSRAVAGFVRAAVEVAGSAPAIVA